ncbi:unnamed protein product, partial [Prorocentrum cordatum]
WTLGILIYEMICGQPPFCDEDPMGIYQKILAGKVYFPKYFDKNAKALVKKLLTADLSKRYGNLKDGPQDVLKHPWFASLNLAELEEYKVPAPYKPKMSSENDFSNYEETSRTPTTPRRPRSPLGPLHRLVRPQRRLAQRRPREAVKCRRIPIGATGLSATGRPVLGPLRCKVWAATPPRVHFAAGLGGWMFGWGRGGGWNHFERGGVGLRPRQPAAVRGRRGRAHCTETWLAAMPFCILFLSHAYRRPPVLWRAVPSSRGGGRGGGAFSPCHLRPLRTDMSPRPVARRRLCRD